ncbi:MAG: hypothetical protein GEV08_11900, partial [Acidimicrobiia bacterium]|nr:hypothetical protein [Acidimicrobiia bacterium]
LPPPHRLVPRCRRGAIRLGGDTDTVASMAGALAGAHLGEDAIPRGWRQRAEAADELRGSPAASPSLRPGRSRADGGGVTATGGSLRRARHLDSARGPARDLAEKDGTWPLLVGAVAIQILIPQSVATAAGALLAVASPTAWLLEPSCRPPWCSSPPKCALAPRLGAPGGSGGGGPGEPYPYVRVECEWHTTTRPGRSTRCGGTRWEQR